MKKSFLRFVVSAMVFVVFGFSLWSGDWLIALYGLVSVVIMVFLFSILLNGGK